MKTVHDLQMELEKRLDQLEQDWLRDGARLKDRYEDLITEARQLGGIIWRDEIAAFLGVSEPRVSVLISTGRFRSDASGRKFSLADVEEYKRTRKPGRPSRYG